jgi:TonB family protein
MQRLGSAGTCALVLGMLGCGGAAVRGPDHARDERLASADPAAIRSLLDTAVGYGGLWFDDAACRAQFPSARTIGVDELDRFAGCLAGLGLSESPRSILPDVDVLQSRSGLEIEARLVLQGRTAQLAWIGYVGRDIDVSPLPMVTPAALEARRLAGDRSGLDETSRPVIAAEAARASGTVVAWLDVCVDAQGAVDGVRVVQTSSVAASAAFEASVRGWKFRPFLLGGQPAAVCSLVELGAATATQPSAATAIPLPPLDPSAVGFVPGPRVAGATFLPPTEAVKRELAQQDIHQIVGTFRFCIDETGQVAKVGVYESTGSETYDQTLVRAIETWRYPPVAGASGPVAACGAVTFQYDH